MSRYYHSSSLRGIASALFALVLVFTFPIWLPLWTKLAELVGAILVQVIGGLR